MGKGTRRNPVKSRRVPPARMGRRPAHHQASRFDYLYARPHVVADFSLPPQKIHQEYSRWEQRVERELSRDGFTAKEIAKAIKSAGGFQAFKRGLIEQNQQRKISAQEFAGYHHFEPDADTVTIPVITGAPQDVRFKFDAQGNFILQEKSIKTRDVKFDPVKLAKGKRKYLEQLLSQYGEKDRFYLMMGDYMTVTNSGYKSTIIEKILRYMNRYSGAATRGANNKEHYWKNWMMGIRVSYGADNVELESQRQSFARLHREMKAAKKAQYDKEKELNKQRIREHNRDRQRRKRARDNFIK